MKHAILILAHKNIGQLCRLAGYFEKDCDVSFHDAQNDDFQKIHGNDGWMYG